MNEGDGRGTGTQGRDGVAEEKKREAPGERGAFYAVAPEVTSSRLAHHFCGE